jgi:hypothetical protein
MGDTNEKIRKKIGKQQKNKREVAGIMEWYGVMER